MDQIINNYYDYSGDINNPSFPEKYLLIADYSPLSGGGSGFSYRPPRRGMIYWLYHGKVVRGGRLEKILKSLSQLSLFALAEADS